MCGILFPLDDLSRHNAEMEAPRTPYSVLPVMHWICSDEHRSLCFLLRLAGRRYKLYSRRDYRIYSLQNFCLVCIGCYSNFVQRMPGERPFP